MRRLWEKVYEQAKGFLYQDGGPVIGMQIENEYGHVGGYNGERVSSICAHLQQWHERLALICRFARQRGWGGAATGGLLPVMGWLLRSTLDQRITEIEPTQIMYLVI